MTAKTKNHSTKSTLTDRYIHTVTRHLPADGRDDVARELRGTIADAVDDKISGGLTPEGAEREAVTELGDPITLARSYGGRPGYLIGPGIYPDYIRLMRVLPAIVLPLVLVANFIAKATTSDEHWGSVLLEAFLLMLSVAVHLAFWVTVTFAIIEWSRPEEERNRPLDSWNPDQLAEVPGRGVGLGETIFGAVFSLALAALVAWQFGGVDRNSVQVLNPDVDTVWQVALVVLIALDAVLALLVWRAGRWTPVLAALNVATNAASATLLLWLLSRDELLVADLPGQLEQKFGWSSDWSVPVGLVGAGIVVVAAWEAIDSIVKARRDAGGAVRS